ncbi:MAG TPA: sigma-70 family RNA polymerase sigma factor [Planctomycetota bacterium]|nr:sigma-70 family RNA polymerase sigma factor [Planctomycetota bacterium]
MSSDPTQFLVRNAVGGDRRAFETLLERYLPQVRAFVHLRLSPELRVKESSSDIAQSVCRELLQGLDQFHWRGEDAFRGWLFTVALRKVADRAQHYGAAKRELGREQSPEDDAHAADLLCRAYGSLSSPSGHAVARELAERIGRLFETLSDDEREVLTLARVAGLSRAEIGRRIGKSEGAVRVTLHRALVKLSDAIEEH